LQKTVHIHHFDNSTTKKNKFHLCVVQPLQYFFEGDGQVKVFLLTVMERDWLVFQREQI